MKRTPLKKKPYSWKRKKDSPAKRAFAKVKKESISSLKKKAWTEFSKYIRARDNHTCYTCGKKNEVTGSKFMHAGHFITRSANSTLFDEENVHAQCFYCNIRARGNTREYAYRLKNELGAERFLALIDRGKQTKQWTAEDLRGIALTYREKYNEITKQ